MSAPPVQALRVDTELQPITASPHTTPKVPDDEFHRAERKASYMRMATSPRLSDLVRDVSQARRAAVVAAPDLEPNGASTSKQPQQKQLELAHPFSPPAPNQLTHGMSSPALMRSLDPLKSATGSGASGDGSSGAATTSALQAVARQKSAMSPSDANASAEHKQRVAQQALEEFGSGALVLFDFEVFVRELVYHVLQPLVISLIWWREGGVFGLQNRAFLPVHAPGSRSFWLGTFSWACFWLAIVLYAILGRTSNLISSYEFGFVCLIFCSRIVVIAIKYGYFTAEDWQAFLGGVMSADDVRRSMIIAGWGNYDMDIIERELLFAHQRTGVFLCNRSMAFTYPAEEREHPGFTRRLERVFAHALQLANGDKDAFDMWRKGIQKGQICVRMYCLQLLVNVNRAVANRRFWVGVCALVACFQAVLPCVMRVWSGENFFGDNVFDRVFVVLTVPSTVYIHFANALYLRVAIVDYGRRLRAMRQLSHVLCARENFVPSAVPSLVELPAIDFHVHHNIYDWVALRHVVKDFGARPFARIQAYSSFFLTASMVLIGFTLYVVLLEDNSDETLLALSGFILLCTVSALFQMTLLARKINGVHREHTYILARMQVLIARKILLLGSHDDDNDDETTANKTMTALQCAINIVNASDTNYPVRIVGFEASGNFLRALLTLGIVGLAVWLQAVWQSADK